MTTTTTEIAIPARDPELDRLARLGTWLAYAESGSNTPEARGATAALRIYYAQELGLPPLAAAELSVIKGRLFVGAKLLRALAARHGYRVIRVFSTDDEVTAALIQLSTGEEVGRYSYTIDNARKAGLVRAGSAWETHPARMLWARASKYVLDDYAPEVTLGIYTDEEGAEILGVAAALDDDYSLPPAAIDVDDEGIPWPDSLQSAIDPELFPPAGEDDEEGGPP